MISLHYTSHTKAYNTIYTACNIVEAIYSFTRCSLLKVGAYGLRYNYTIRVALNYEAAMHECRTISYRGRILLYSSCSVINTAYEI